MYLLETINWKKTGTVFVLLIIAGGVIFFLHRLQSYTPSITGSLVSNDELWDGEYSKPMPYAVLYRKSEMYSWIETKTEKNGTTTYDYHKDWQEVPISAVFFNNSADHYNPPQKAIQSRMIISTTTSINGYHIDLARAHVPTLLPVTLSLETIIARADVSLVDNTYLFKSLNGKSSYANPDIGDVRVSYTGLPTGVISTAFGKIEGPDLIPYVSGSETIYSLLPGTREEALKALEDQ